MEKEYTLGELKALDFTLEVLSKEDTPIMFEISKNRTAINKLWEPEIQAFETAKNILVEQKALKDENGKMIPLPEDNIICLMAKVGKLNAEYTRIAVDLGENKDNVIETIANDFKAILEKKCSISLKMIEGDNLNSLLKTPGKAEKYQLVFDYLVD